MYKMIAVDMDGTLLSKDKKISKRTQAAIYKAMQKGIKIVLATGRPLEGVSRYLEQLDLTKDDDYVISFNGCLVQNNKTKEVIKRSILKGEDLHRLYKLSKELGVNIHAFTKEGCITPVMSKYSELEGTINGIPVLVTDYEKIAKEEDIIKIMMVEEPEILDRAIARLPKEIYEDYTVVKSAPFFLEFLNKKANKGEGLRALTKHLNIRMDETIAIGDAGNDAHMIEYAGLGVAMANAFPEVKQISDYITASNNDDGVAQVIEKFVLCE